MPRSLNPKPKPNTKRVTAHIHVSMIKTLESEAFRTGQNVSQIIRRALDKYYDIEADKENTEFFTDILRPIVRDEIDKQANRLASMLFKIGVISAGNYFLAVRMMSDVISPSMMEDFDAINANARKLGIDYMKQSGVGVIEYLEDDDKVVRAAEKLKTDWYK